MCDGIDDPNKNFSGSGPVQYSPAETTPKSDIAKALAEYEQQLLSVAGVTSVGIGFGPAGGEAIEVGVTDAGVAENLPSDIAGIPVIVSVIGEVDALPRR